MYVVTVVIVDRCCDFVLALKSLLESLMLFVELTHTKSYLYVCCGFNNNLLYIVSPPLLCVGSLSVEPVVYLLQSLVKEDSMPLARVLRHTLGPVVLRAYLHKDTFLREHSC